ncbi:hypothetical protein PY650_26395 [Rhizobium calliandrae]|uniref:Uncharacterized protein n=1 Tax=Rhizobium calliandrae TaxID=1312182 RepID=A0ABT7KKL2_9HYPH|nr:hypothetical protein [Rhizobium calliandrae]MDL2409102.1 hypothetical protein [Rhizobium calliandrae]
MTGHVSGFGRHLFGLLLATIAAMVIFAIWEYGLDYLDGTPFEELQYVIFGMVAIGVLSGLNSVMSKLMR